MGLQKFGVGEILPDGVINSLKSKFASWTQSDDADLEAELNEEEEDV